MALLPLDARTRAARQYWQVMTAVKLRSVALGLARDRLSRMMSLVEMIKAAGSSGGVAGWVIWRDMPLLWAVIIMAAQLLDALKYALPFARQHAEAAKLAAVLELLFIDAEYEWERICDGQMKPLEISQACRSLKISFANAVSAHNLHGLNEPPRLLRRATQETTVYMSRIESEVRRDEQV